MTTFLLHRFNILTTGADGGHKYITSEFEHHGILNKLTAYFIDKIEENKIPSDGPISVSGKRDPTVVEIILNDAEVSSFPTTDNWETFFINELFKLGATIGLDSYSDNYYLNAWHNNMYISCDFDQSKMLLKKVEFGRYLPEKPEYKGKESSWTKGVFTKSDNFNVRFLQTSWDGENGEDFQFTFTSDNKQKIKNALRVPLEFGWTEEDFRISTDGFYKTRASININGKTQSWTYTLLDIGEQDIPMITDKLDQWLRTSWGDSFFNNKRRHIDKTEIKPMNGK